jgi:hypothetical protein
VRKVIAKNEMNDKLNLVPKWSEQLASLIYEGPKDINKELLNPKPGRLFLSVDLFVWYQTDDGFTQFKICGCIDKCVSRWRIF